MCRPRIGPRHAFSSSESSGRSTVSMIDLQRPRNQAVPDARLAAAAGRAPQASPTPPADAAIVGLGYVGLTLAVALADRGLRVLGYEANAAVRERLACGETHFWEKGLDPRFREQLGHG